MPWFAQLLSRGRRYDDISVSIQEHIEHRVDELMADGSSRTQAERTARREFGNVALLEQRSREVWQWPALESILADLKFTLRRLRKSPGFAVTVLLTLAIGIGANTAVFSVVNSVLLKPLPYPDSEQLVALWLNAPGAGGLANFTSGLQLSSSMYLTFSQHNRTFQSMGIWTPSTASVTGVAEPEEVRTAMISDGILETLQVPPVAGRWLSQVDQDPHGRKSVVLSYGYWQHRFGGDRRVLGRTIQVDAQSREIVGVMPRGFRLVDRDFDLLIPLALDRSNQKLAGFGYDGIGRLKPGIPLSQADADIARLIPAWMDSWSNGPGSNSHFYERWRITPGFRSLKQKVIGGVDSVLWVVMATVGLVMLIACTNVANLLLVRAESRHQELSIRSALGAGRMRIARELLIESVSLGLMGGIIAIGIAFASLRLLVAIGPTNLPRLSEVSLDARALGFTFALSVLSGLLFGSIPALRYARTQHAPMMGGANRTASAGHARLRSRNVLVVAQVAMALVLLVSALLMIRTFAALRNVQPGFADPQHLQTMRIWIPDLLVSDPQMVTHLQNNIADKLAAIPGVTSVGFAGTVPMQNIDPNWDEIRIEGKNYEAGEPPLRLFNYVSPSYFTSMGTRLVAGRDFTWTDLYGLRPRVIVSENFARESWGSASAAVGKRLRQFSSMPWQEVIGVVEDVRMHGVDENAPAIVYWPAMLNDPYAQKPTISAPRFVTFAIRSSRAGTESFLSQVQQAVWSVNGSLPLASVNTMQELYSQSLARTSFTLVMLAIAGTMALALSLIGIYGVISYTVSQRTREIGIRLALGAQKSVLRWMFVRSALILTAVGVAIGLGAAATLTQLMKKLLFGISPLDPLTFVAVPLILATAATLASYLPARRAAGVDPVEALRSE
ncbi:ABC transporter permease [Granulicella sp. dw_53]|uniref:ABC transporter permease n=1 Tax=Granulicella sp. dw_53 TaxID=2719792 RepID=UPI001BD1EB55|nr:ABC transporter permease [Granulicella sp. dw_53]